MRESGTQISHDALKPRELTANLQWRLHEVNVLSSTLLTLFDGQEQPWTYSMGNFQFGLTYPSNDLNILSHVTAQRGQVEMTLSDLIGRKTDIRIVRPDDANYFDRTITVTERRKDKVVSTLTIPIRRGHIILEEMTHSGSPKRLEKLIDRARDAIEGTSIEFRKRQLASGAKTILAKDAIVKRLSYGGGGGRRLIDTELDDIGHAHGIPEVVDASAFHRPLDTQWWNMNEYARVPEKVSLSTDVLQGARLLTALTEGDTKVLQELGYTPDEIHHFMQEMKGKETAAFILKKNRDGQQTFTMSDDFFDPRVPIRDKIIIGSESHINDVLSAVLALREGKNESGIMHTHPGFTEEEIENIIGGRLTPNQAEQLRNWGFMPQTRKAREIVLHSLLSIPPSLIDIATASRLYETGGTALVISHRKIYLIAPTAESAVISQHDKTLLDAQREQGQEYATLIKDLIQRAEDGEFITYHGIEKRMIDYVTNICRNMKMAIYAGRWYRTADEPLVLERL